MYARDAAELGPKVAFVGRLAEYCYLNMDEVVARALSAFLQGCAPMPAENVIAVVVTYNRKELLRGSLRALLARRGRSTRSWWSTTPVPTAPRPCWPKSSRRSPCSPSTTTPAAPAASTMAPAGPTSTAPTGFGSWTTTFGSTHDALSALLQTHAEIVRSGSQDRLVMVPVRIIADGSPCEIPGTKTGLGHPFCLPTRWTGRANRVKQN